MSKNRHTSDSFPKEISWYPRFASDRADELIAELDAGQQSRLLGGLKTRTYAEWLTWLGDARGEIATYDGLSRAQRTRRLQPRPDTEILLLHHACIFVELWRARLDRQYCHLPPYGPPLESHENHRSMMVNIMTAFDRYDPRDLWPFDSPEDAGWFPFSDCP